MGTPKESSKGGQHGPGLPRPQRSSAYGTLEVTACGLRAAAALAEGTAQVAKGAAKVAEVAARLADVAARTAHSLAAFAAQEAAIAVHDDAVAARLAAAYARQAVRKVAKAARAVARVLKKAAKVAGRAAVTVATAACKYSGAQDVVSCVTHPQLSSCVKAALTVALVVATGGEGEVEVRVGNKTAVIDTTGSHLFWVPGAGGHSGRWVKAGALKYGNRLRTPGGSDTAAVVGGWIPSQQRGWMWDLTVPGNNDHDFYIDTVAASVLVHNLTRAGRAFAKHANLFPSVSGGPGALSEAGQDVLDEILTNPGTVIRGISKGNFAGGQYFIGTSGIGAAFDSGGVFQYFGAMTP